MDLSSLLGTGGSVLGLIGQGMNAATNYDLMSRLKSVLGKKTPALAIPQAYQQLGDKLNSMIATMGDSQKQLINQQFNQSLASALGKLQQAGLSSSNLTANLSAGNERQRQGALSDLQTQLTGMQVGALQNTGLQGLGTQAGFINQQNQIKGNILANYSRGFGPNNGVAGNPIAGLGSLATGLGSLVGMI